MSATKSLAGRQRDPDAAREANAALRMFTGGLPRAANSGEIFLTLAPRDGEPLIELLARAASVIRERNARVLEMTVFNGCAQYAAAKQQLPSLFGELTWPTTLLHSEASSFYNPGGVEIHALADPSREVRNIVLRDRVVGTTWEDADARYCILGDLRTESALECPDVQTRRVFDDMLEALEQAGMTFQHVYRTWFRNRDILAWYREFNHVRTEFYHQHRVFDGLLPASTGISAGNPHGVALVAGLWAMLPKSPRATAIVVNSPLQDSACRYGSSFSRAVEMRRGTGRHLTISGTASIGSDGKTLHAGDTDSQTELTMQIVSAILRSRGMDWPDVVRGLAYYRYPNDAGAYSRWARAHGVILPVIEINHTICREDLLFEIELDASRASPID